MYSFVCDGLSGGFLRSRGLFRGSGEVLLPGPDRLPGQGARESAGALGSQLPQPLHAAQEIAPPFSKPPPGALVAPPGPVQLASQLLHMGGEGDESIVDLPRFPGDRSGVSMLADVAPGAFDGLEGGQEGGGTHQEDPAGEGLVQEAGLPLQGRRQSPLDGDKHQHQLQALDPPGPVVLLAGEELYMAAQGAQMLPDLPLLLLGLLGVDPRFVGLERGLGVDDDLALSGEVHDHVGAHPPLLGPLQDRLHPVLPAPAQSRSLQDLVEDHLSPGPLAFVFSLEGPGQTQGLPADVAVELLEPGELLHQRRHRAALLGMDLVDPAAKLLHLPPQGGEQLFDLLAGVRAEAPGVLLQAPG